MKLYGATRNYIYRNCFVLSAFLLQDATTNLKDFNIVILLFDHIACNLKNRIKGNKATSPYDIWPKWAFYDILCSQYPLLNEFEGPTVSYGLCFFHFNLRPPREARGL